MSIPAIGIFTTVEEAKTFLNNFELVEPRPIRFSQEVLRIMTPEEKQKRFDRLGRGILRSSPRNVEIIKTRGMGEVMLVLPITTVT